MAQNQGTVPIRGTSAAVGTPVTFTITTAAGGSISGYVMPITSGIQITHTASRDNVIDGDGEVVGVGAWGEYLEATFTLIPSAATLANARISATLPTVLSTVAITGADVIAVGPFADAINVTSGDPGGNKWIYEGGGSLSVTAGGQTTMTLPLRRYPEIAGGTAIVS